MNVYKIAADFNLKPRFETPSDVVWSGVFTEGLGHILTANRVFFTTQLQDNRELPGYGKQIVHFVQPRKAETE